MPENIITEKKSMPVKKQNKVKFVGSVVRVAQYAPATTVLTVAVNDSNGEVQYPKIAFYGARSFKSIGEQVKITAQSKPRVIAEGYISSTGTRTPEGKYIQRQSFVGEKLGFALTAMEEETGLKNVGHRKLESVNRITVVGTVSSVFRFDSKSGNKIAVLTIATCNNDNVAQSVRVICTGSNVDRCEGLDYGDAVSVIGQVRTKEKTDANNKRYTDSTLFALDVDKVVPDEESTAAAAAQEEAEAASE